MACVCGVSACNWYGQFAVSGVNGVSESEDTGSVCDQREEDLPTAEVSIADQRVSRAQSGDVPCGRIRDLREGGSACGVLCGCADWAAVAEPDLYAQLSGYGCARGQLGEVWRRSGVEEAVERSEVQVRSADRVEYHEPGTTAAGILADLVPVPAPDLALIDNFTLGTM